MAHTTQTRNTYAARIAPAVAFAVLILLAFYVFGQILTVQTPLSVAQPKSAASQTLDLGAGYTLKDGQIIAPLNKVLPTQQKIDLQGGYWLIDGQIIH